MTGPGLGGDEIILFAMMDKNDGVTTFLWVGVPKGVRCVNKRGTCNRNDWKMVAIETGLVRELVGF